MSDGNVVQCECINADSNLAALQPDSPGLLAREHSAHSADEGEATVNANPDRDDEEDDLSIMSMTDDEEEEAHPPVRCEKHVLHVKCMSPAIELLGSQCI